MIRLNKIFIRPLLEYGHTATEHAIKPWENNQAKYITNTATTQHLTRKHTEIRQLNHHQNKTERPGTKMVQKNLYTKNNTPIIEFINTHVRDYHKMDKHKTPYKIIETLIIDS